MTSSSGSFEILWTLLAVISPALSTEVTKSSVFGESPIRIGDLGSPPATLTIPLYDCSQSHRSTEDAPNSFQVFHNNEWYTQSCQDGLVWNQTLCRCEFPKGKEYETICRDYRATRVEPTNIYEQFVNGQWIVRDCSLVVAGLVWNQELCQCVWGPHSKEMITGQGITPCDIMLNMTFEDGVKDNAKNSFVGVERGGPLQIFNLSKLESVDGNKAAYFNDTALKIWHFADNEIGASLRVEFRFKMANKRAQSDQYQMFISNGCNTALPGYSTPSIAIGYRTSDQSYLLAFETTSTRKAIVCHRKLSLNDWHTVSLIYEDGTLLFRVDNQPCIISKDFSGAIQKTLCPLTIGADPLVRESVFNGYIDNILIARYCRRFIDTDQGVPGNQIKDPRLRRTAAALNDIRSELGTHSSDKGNLLNRNDRNKQSLVPSTKYMSEIYSSAKMKSKKIKQPSGTNSEKSSTTDESSRSVGKAEGFTNIPDNYRASSDSGNYRNKVVDSDKEFGPSERTVEYASVLDSADKTDKVTPDYGYSIKTDEQGKILESYQKRRGGFTSSLASNTFKDEFSNSDTKSNDGHESSEIKTIYGSNKSGISSYKAVSARKSHDSRNRNLYNESERKSHDSGNSGFKDVAGRKSHGSGNSGFKDVSKSRNHDSENSGKTRKTGSKHRNSEQVRSHGNDSTGKKRGFEHDLRNNDKKHDQDDRLRSTGKTSRLGRVLEKSNTEAEGNRYSGGVHTGGNDDLLVSVDESSTLLGNKQNNKNIPNDYEDDNAQTTGGNNLDNRQRKTGTTDNYGEQRDKLNGDKFVLEEDEGLEISGQNARKLISEENEETSTDDTGSIEVQGAISKVQVKKDKNEPKENGDVRNENVLQSDLDEADFKHINKDFIEGSDSTREDNSKSKNKGDTNTEIVNITKTGSIVNKFSQKTTGSPAIEDSVLVKSEKYEGPQKPETEEHHEEKGKKLLRRMSYWYESGDSSLRHDHPHLTGIDLSQGSVFIMDRRNRRKHRSKIPNTQLVRGRRRFGNRNNWYDKADTSKGILITPTQNSDNQETQARQQRKSLSSGEKVVKVSKKVKTDKVGTRDSRSSIAGHLENNVPRTQSIFEKNDNDKVVTNQISLDPKDNENHPNHLQRKKHSSKIAPSHQEDTGNGFTTSTVRRSTSIDNSPDYRKDDTPRVVNKLNDGKQKTELAFSDNEIKQTDNEREEPPNKSSHVPQQFHGSQQTNEVDNQSNDDIRKIAGWYDEDYVQKYQPYDGHDYEKSHEIDESKRHFDMPVDITKNGNPKSNVWQLEELIMAAEEEM